MSTPRVIVDLNSTDEDGETIVFLSDVSDGTLKVGRMAIAYEPDDHVSAPARVASIYPERGVAFLQVDWRSMKRMSDESNQFRLAKHGWMTASAAATRSAEANIGGRATNSAARHASANTSGH